MAKTVGNYIIESKIGFGSFASVYKAVHKDSGEKFAVKMIAKEKLGNDDRLYQNLESEIKIMRDYNHPNIVRLFEHMTSARNIYLVLEYCPGGDLQKLVKKHHHLPEDVSRAFLGQVSDGLAFLHCRNVIHRDIKPQNLLLSDGSFTGVLKLADFGFAKHLTEASMAQTPCGTPLYMAPEIFQMREYDAKADLWSLGCVFYEMLVGTTPYRGGSPKELFTNIQTKALAIPNDIILSNDTVILLRMLLERDPQQRSTLDNFRIHYKDQQYHIEQLQKNSNNNAENDSNMITITTTIDGNALGTGAVVVAAPIVMMSFNGNANIMDQQLFQQQALYEVSPVVPNNNNEMNTVQQQQLQQAHASSYNRNVAQTNDAVAAAIASPLPIRTNEMTVNNTLNDNCIAMGFISPPLPTAPDMQQSMTQLSNDLTLQQQQLQHEQQRQSQYSTNIGLLTTRMDSNVMLQQQNSAHYSQLPISATTVVLNKQFVTNTDDQLVAQQQTHLKQQQLQNQLQQQQLNRSFTNIRVYEGDPSTVPFVTATPIGGLTPNTIHVQNFHPSFSVTANNNTVNGDAFGDYTTQQPQIVLEGHLDIKNNYHSKNSSRGSNHNDSSKNTPVGKPTSLFPITNDNDSYNNGNSNGSNNAHKRGSSNSSPSYDQYDKTEADEEYVLVNAYGGAENSSSIPNVSSNSIGNGNGGNSDGNLNAMNVDGNNLAIATPPRLANNSSSSNGITSIHGGHFIPNIYQHPHSPYSSSNNLSVSSKTQSFSFNSNDSNTGSNNLGSGGAVDNDVLKQNLRQHPSDADAIPQPLQFSNEDRIKALHSAEKEKLEEIVNDCDIIYNRYIYTIIAVTDKIICEIKAKGSRQQQLQQQGNDGVLSATSATSSSVTVTSNITVTIQKYRNALSLYLHCVMLIYPLLSQTFELSTIIMEGGNVSNRLAVQNLLKILLDRFDQLKERASSSHKELLEIQQMVSTATTSAMLSNNTDNRLVANEQVTTTATTTGATTTTANSQNQQQLQLPSPEAVLYSIAMQLAFDANVAELLGQLDNSSNMYETALQLLDCIMHAYKTLQPQCIATNTSINVTSKAPNDTNDMLDRKALAECFEVIFKQKENVDSRNRSKN